MQLLASINESLDQLFAGQWNDLFEGMICLIDANEIPCEPGDELEDCYDLSEYDLSSERGVLKFMKSVIEGQLEECPTLHGADLGGSLFSLHCDYRGQSGPEITEVDIYEDRVCWIQAFKDQGYLLVPEVFTGELISHTDEELLVLYERRV
jgi:hypothetical protein